MDFGWFSLNFQTKPPDCSYRKHQKTLRMAPELQCWLCLGVWLSPWNPWHPHSPAAGDMKSALRIHQGRQDVHLFSKAQLLKCSLWLPSQRLCHHSWKLRLATLLMDCPASVIFLRYKLSASRNSSIVPWISWQNAPNRSILHNCGTFYTTACLPINLIRWFSSAVLLTRNGAAGADLHGMFFCQDLIAPENKCEFTATQMGVVPVQQTIFTFFGRCFIVWVWNIQVLRHLIRPANRKLGHFSTGGLSDRFPSEVFLCDSQQNGEMDIGGCWLVWMPLKMIDIVDECWWSYW